MGGANSHHKGYGNRGEERASCFCIQSTPDLDQFHRPALLPSCTISGNSVNHCVGAEGRLPQDEPLQYEDYFELKAILDPAGLRNFCPSVNCIEECKLGVGGGGSFPE